MPAEQSPFPKSPDAALPVVVSLLKTLHDDWLELADETGALDSRRAQLSKLTAETIDAYGGHSKFSSLPICISKGASK